MTRPPRLARLLLRLLPADDREFIAGDLEEEYARIRERRGPLRAHLWFWAHALASVVSVLAERGVSRMRRGRSQSLVSLLDVKLGARMLVKHAGLSAVATVGLAVGVGIGAAAFGAVRAVTASPLPLDEGERVVTIQNRLEGDQARRTHLHDLELWRAELTAVEELSAYRTVTRNVVSDDGRVEPVRIAEMSASGFRLTRVAPLLGRWIDDADERAGSPAVAVIGYGEWQGRFGGRRDIVGRTVRIGATPHTVIGVMPEGFAFPVNNRLWTPLRLDARDFTPGSAPAVDVFGRLAPGYDLEQAGVQAHTLAARAAAADPATHAGVTTDVFPFTQELVWGMGWMFYLLQLLVSMVLVVIAINVAALVYARTSARTAELAVRSALGASRARIVTQLVVEALFLAGAACVGGLLAARWALRQVGLFLAAGAGEQLPFWWRFELTPMTVGYAAGLAALATVIVGLIPALGATGRGVGERLKRAGVAGPKLGRGWSVLIVVQVAAAVAILPVALHGGQLWLRARAPAPESVLDQMLSGWIYLDVESLGDQELETQSDGFLTRYAELRDELVRRVELDPAVERVTLMSTAPWEDPDVPVEIGGGRPGEAVEAAPVRAGLSRVDAEFFDAFDLPILEGRSFSRVEAADEAPVAIVDRTFVERVLGGADAVGRQVRLQPWRASRQSEEAPAEADVPRWYTIVGVVRAFHPSSSVGPNEPKLFLPALPGERYPLSVAIRTAGTLDAGRYTERLRALALEVDPMLRITGLRPLDEVYGGGMDSMMRLMLATLAGLAVSGLLVAVAGLYAFMSFTVVRRRRDIGIRSALGARPERVVATILARAFAQVALGIAIGVALTGSLDRLSGEGLLGEKSGLLLPLVAAAMALIGVLAAWGPARAGLRIQPTEALRADA